MNRLFLFVIVIFISCQGENLIKQEITSSYFKEVFYIDKDSLRQGPYVELSLAGDTISTVSYMDDLMQGARKIFNQDGNLQTIEHYEKGKFHGPVTTYYPNGSIETKGNYTNDVLDSLFFSFYETGELKEKVTMRDNAENGPFEEYYKNGKVHWKGVFIDGDNEIGILEEYDISGTLIKKMDCGKYKGEYICQTIWDIERGDVTPLLEYEE